MKSGQESLFGRLEDVIEQFEAACTAGENVRIAAFLPERRDPQYLIVLQELARVSLERRLRAGEDASVEDYRDEFPELFDSTEILKPLAFEEYRLRLQSPSPIAAAVFAERYGIDISRWPSAPASGSSRKTGVSQGVEADFQPGARVLDFVIVGELGRGAFSKVYLARQSSLSDRLVVLKFSSLRFNEAERLARLQHTNIVPVYSLHETGPFSVLCMPWFGATTLKEVIQSLIKDASLPTGQTFLSTITACDSRTLAALNVDRPVTGSASANSRDRAPSADRAASANRNRVSAAGTSPKNNTAGRDEMPIDANEHGSSSPLAKLSPERAVLWIGERLAKALTHAHARGILHRDLKPANVLLTEDGQPMILDFNLAVENDPLDQHHSEAGGTLPYMSPEQISSIDTFKSLNVQSDVYSLGVILFEMLTGRLPFSVNGGDRARMIHERWSSIPSVRQFNSQISVDTESIVQKCLQPELQNRYQMAQQLHDDLLHQLNDEPLVYAANRSWKERFQKWTRRHPGFVSVSGVSTLAAVLVLVTGGLWWQSQRQLEAATSRELFLQFQKQLPQLQAEALSAALGETPRESAEQSLRAAISPLIATSAETTAADESATRKDHSPAITAAARLWSNSPQVHPRIASALSLNDARTLQQEIQELSFFGARLQSSESGSTGDASAPTDGPSVSDDNCLAATQDKYLAATELVFRHRFSEAHQLLAPVLLEHPDRFPVVLLQGMLERAHGRPDDAEALLTSAIALQPENAEAWYQRGVCRVNRGRYEDAVQDFSQVLELKPSSDAARISRAICRQHLGDFQAALSDLNDAIEHGFPETRVYFLRAAVHGDLQDIAAADKDKAEGLSRTPTDERSWVARGLAQLPQKPDLAMADFQEALRLNPASHDAFRNMSMVLSEYLRDADQSIRVLTDAMTHHPQDAYLWAGRGVLHARGGRRDAAIQDAADARKRSKEPLVVYMVSCIYALTAKGHPEDAAVALPLLAESLLGDMSLAKVAASDSDLQAIQTQPAFDAILQATKILTHP